MEKAFPWVTGEMSPLPGFPSLWGPFGTCAKSTSWWLHPGQAHGLKLLGGSALVACQLPSSGGELPLPSQGILGNSGALQGAWGDVA